MIKPTYLTTLGIVGALSSIGFFILDFLVEFLMRGLPPDRLDAMLLITTGLSILIMLCGLALEYKSLPPIS